MSKEVLPDPGDMFQSLRYLQDQAAKGHFKGHTSAYQVLLYLAMNMWTKVPNKEDAGLGEVMYGLAAIGTIAARTVLDRRSVQRAMKWLAEEGWVDTSRAYDASGREDRRYIMVRLDTAAHRERERLRAAGDALENIAREGVTVSPREGGRKSPPGGRHSVTPGGRHSVTP